MALLVCAIIWTTVVLKSAALVPNLSTTPLKGRSSRVLENPDFTTLKNLGDRCQAISNKESEYLLSFWSPSLNCFQLDSSMSTTKVSVTTTCMCLHTILSNPTHWESLCQWEESTDKSRAISMKNVVKSLVDAPWRDGDGFQHAFLVDILGKLKADYTHVKFQGILNELLDNRPRLSLHRNQMNSAYLRHLNSNALRTVLSSNVVVDEFTRQRINHSLKRANDVAFDELCRQIAFHNAGDTANFDIIVLGFTLASYWQISQRFFFESRTSGVVPRTNMNLVAIALDILFSEQAPDGTWRKGEPISAVGESQKNIGNSYVFFFDLIESVLTCVGETNPELLAPYVPNLERCIAWAESNVLQEVITEGFDGGSKIVKGWRSNHLGSGPAIGWCTAQVFSGITSIRKLLKSLIKKNILEEFGSRKTSDEPSQKQWSTLMDSDMELAGKQTTLKKQLYKHILLPQVRKQQSINSAFQNGTERVDTSIPPAYSAILFGPPGTAKTTICHNLASFLGWDFLVIDTAKFLSSGLEYVASRMSHIFDRLKALDKTIILFDEIEEFCLDRENPSLSMESRLLTTAMLTQLNDLRRQQSSVFLVATNRLRSFDAAVIRPGRFDMIMFVGTPNLASRVKRFSDKLMSTRVPAIQAQEAATTFEKILTENWDRLRFLTYAENEELIGFAIEAAMRDEFSSAALLKKSESIMRTGTIQGQIQDEYVLSERLSRA